MLGIQQQSSPHITSAFEKREPSRKRQRERYDHTHAENILAKFVEWERKCHEEVEREQREVQRQREEQEAERKQAQETERKRIAAVREEEHRIQTQRENEQYEENIPHTTDNAVIAQESTQTRFEGQSRYQDRNTRQSHLQSPYKTGNQQISHLQDITTKYSNEKFTAYSDDFEQQQNQFLKWKQAQMMEINKKATEARQMIEREKGLLEKSRRAAEVLPSRG